MRSDPGPAGVAYLFRLLWDRRPRRTVTAEGGYKVQFEHPTQLLAATFLRAIDGGDRELVWARLSAETRGLLEGRYAVSAGLALHRAAGVDDDEADARLAEVTRPLLDAVRTAARAAGVPDEAPCFARTGVSAARLVDRTTAYVLLLRDFAEEHIVSEEEWRPSHLLAFTRESAEWRIDLGRTALLSAEAELVDPLGPIR